MTLKSREHDRFVSISGYFSLDHMQVPTNMTRKEFVFDHFNIGDSAFCLIYTTYKQPWYESLISWSHTIDKYRSLGPIFQTKPNG
jgi:hypothetical protein